MGAGCTGAGCVGADGAGAGSSEAGFTAGTGAEGCVGADCGVTVTGFSASGWLAGLASCCFWCAGSFTGAGGGEDAGEPGWPCTAIKSVHVAKSVEKANRWPIMYRGYEGARQDVEGEVW